MSNRNNTIEIFFQGVDNVSNITSSIQSNIQAFEGGITSAAQPLAGLTDDILSLNKAFLSMAAVYGGKALSQFSAFESATIDLKKVLDVTDPSLATFTKTSRELADTYGVASTKILQGIANFKQAGFSAKEAALLQKDALDLVIAGDVDAAAATEILIASLKGFKAEASEAPRFIEALNNVSDKYATNLKELSTGMSKISPIAAKMGFSFEETTGLITPIIEVFRSGSEAANALKTGLLKLIDESKPVADALKSIGVSQKDVNGKLKSGKAIYLEVAKAFQTLDDKTKLSVTSQLVGLDQAGKMVEVFSNLNTVLDIQAVAYQKTGSVQKEVALRLKSVEVQSKKTGVAFNELAIEIGSNLAQSVGSGMDGIQSLLGAMREVAASGGLGDLFDALTEQGEDFEKYLKSIAKALPEAFNGLKFDALIKTFADLRDAVGGVLGGLDLTKVDDLREFLQQVIDHIANITKFSAEAVQQLTAFFSTVSGWLSSLSSADDGLVALLGGLGGISKIVLIIIPALGLLSTAFGVLNGVLTLVGTASAASLLPALAAMLPAIGALVGAVNMLSFAFNANSSAYDDYINRTRGVEDSLKSIAARTDKMALKLHKVSVHTGILVTSFDELNQAQKDGLIVFDKTTQQWENATTVTKKLDDSLIGTITRNSKLSESEAKKAESIAASNAVALETINKNIAIGTSTTQVTAKQTALAKAWDESTARQAKHAATTKKTVESYKVWGGSIKDAKENVRGFKSAMATLARSQTELAKSTLKVHSIMSALAEDTRLAKIKFNVDFNIAKVKADSARVQEAFKAVAVTVKATSDAVASIYGTGRQEGDTFGFELDNQLRNANRRADQALENATKLNDAQIEYMKQRGEAIQRGDAKIRIEGSGLTPILQELLRTLMEEIQLQANSEGLELLL